MKIIPLLVSLALPTGDLRTYKYQKAALKAGLVCRPSEARRLTCLPPPHDQGWAGFFLEWEALGLFVLLSSGGR